MEQVAALLQAAYFGVGAARRTAEETLLASLPCPGTASSLITIAGAAALPVDLRVASVLTLKQVVSRFWKGHEAKGGTGLVEAEKNTVRTALLPLLDAPAAVNSQVAHLLAQVARYDFPHPWASLLDELVAKLRVESASSSTAAQEGGAVRGLAAVLATLVSMRLPIARVTLARLTSPLLSVLAPRLHQALSAALQAQGTDANAMSVWVATRGEHAKLELRSVSRLVKHTRIMSEAPDTATEVLTLLSGALTALVAQRASSAAMNKWMCWMEGKLARTLHAALELHPLGFPLPLMSTHLTFCASQVGAPAVPPNHDLEPLHVACVLFVKTAADNSSYQLVPDAHAHRALIAAFFTPERLLHLSEQLVSGPMVLTQEELNDWQQSPETFLQEDDTDMWRVRLKHAAEAALLVCARPVLAQLVTRLQAQLAVASTDVPSLLRREAHYRAVGTLAPLLSEQLDFGAWFQASLQHELVPDRAVLARRVCHLVSAFALAGGVRNEHRAVLYERMVACLANAQTDLPVRVAAAEALKALVFDVAFEAGPFEPYVRTCLAGLFAIMQRAKEADTQLRVLLIVETVLAQLAGTSLVAHTTALLASLADAWSKAGDAHLVKSSVLRILSQLVQTLGPHSSTLYGLLLPLVRIATAVGSAEELYLLDDGLDLWRELLAVAPTLDPTFLSLYPAITVLLQRGYEQVGSCTRIMELYLLLGQQAFVAAHGTAVVDTITRMVDDIKDEGLLLVLRVADTFIQMFPSALGALEVLLAKCLALVLTKANDDESPVAIRHHLSLLARALLANAPVTLHLLERASPQAAGAIMDLWVDRLDTMDQPFMRKLIALALVRMLQIGATLTGVLARAGAVVGAVTSALGDTEGGYDHFVVLEQDEPGPADSIVSRERGTLYARDPVNALSLRTVTLETLRAVSEQYGQQVIASVDPALIDALLHPPAPPNAPA